MIMRINNICCLKIIRVPISTNRPFDLQIVKNMTNFCNIKLERHCILQQLRGQIKDITRETAPNTMLTKQYLAE